MFDMTNHPDRFETSRHNYRVYEDTLYDRHGDTVPGYKAIVRADTGEAISVVRDTYKVLQHPDLFEHVEEAIGNTLVEEGFDPFGVGTFVDIRDKVSHREIGGWACREYIIPRLSETIYSRSGFETNLIPRIIVINSHDGSSSARMFGGLIDAWCTNGMVVGDVLGKYLRRHTAGLKAIDFVEPVRDTLRASLDAVGAAQIAADTPLDREKAEHVIHVNFGEKAAERLIQRLDDEIEERGDNVFALQSVLTAYATHPDYAAVRRSDPDDRALLNRQERVRQIMASQEWRELLAA